MGLQELESLVHRTATAGEPFERGADEAEQAYLSSLAARPSTKLICEVGFNAGFSSWAFLDASPDTTVVSFDLAAYAYSAAAKAHIDEHFPGRHTLIQGDSHTTIAAYAKDLKLEFVDEGGHILMLVNGRSLTDEEHALFESGRIKSPARAASLE